MVILYAIVARVVTRSFFGSMQFHPYGGEAAFVVEDQDKVHSAELGSGCTVPRPCFSTTMRVLVLNVGLHKPKLKCG